MSEAGLGRVLWIGVCLSAGAFLAGTAWTLAVTPAGDGTGGAALRTLASFGRDAGPGALAGPAPTLLLTLGVLLLLATPALRLAVAAGRFARDGDRLYAAIEAGVLLLVLAAIVAQRAGG